MEDLLKALGGCGRFQWIASLCIKMSVVPISWSMLQMAIAGVMPDWWCLPSSQYHGNSSSSSSSLANGVYGNWSRGNTTFQTCEIPGSEGESCAGHIVFDDTIHSVVNEWSLVCDLKYIKPLMTSLQMGGVLVGAALGGQTSDSLGRRVTLYTALACHLVISLVAAFSVNWQMFIALRILTGITIGSFLTSYFSYPFEFVTSNYRQIIAFIPGWNTGVIIFAFIAWLFPHWSHLHIGSALITLPALLTFFVTPESPRWLAVKGRLREAEHVMDRMAKINRHPKPENALPTLQRLAEEEKAAGQGRRYTYLDIYRGWRMAFTSLILNFTWFSMSLSYYGISFGVSALSGSVYFNMFLMSILETPSNFSTIFLANRLGRRWTCFIFFIICAAASFGILLVDKTVSEGQQGMVTTVLAMISRICVGSAWISNATFASELYPTVVRSLGYGASSVMARVGGILAPMLLNMDSAEDVVRGYIIVGSLMVVNAVFSLLLRETRGQDLRDSFTISKVEDKMDGVKVGWESEGHRQPTDGQLSVWTVNGERKKDGTVEASHSDFISVRL